MEVIGCETSTIGSLEFAFKSGICCTAQDRIYLGFAIGFIQELRSTDNPLSTFDVLANPAYDHYAGNRAAANSSELIFFFFQVNVFINSKFKKLRIFVGRWWW